MRKTIRIEDLLRHLKVLHDIIEHAACYDAGLESRPYEEIRDEYGHFISGEAASLPVDRTAQDAICLIIHYVKALEES